MKSLGDVEFEVMEVLWSVNEPVTVSYITEHLKTRSHWKISTVLTVLSRLTDKGIIECDRTKRRNLYKAILTEDEYKTAQARAVISNLYNNSLANLVSSWLADEKVSEEEFEKIEKTVKQAREKKHEIDS